MNLAAIIRDLERFEGRYPWIYLDVRGYPTIGVGNLVATADAAAKLPLERPRTGAPSAPATEEEKRAAWAVVAAAKPNMRASFYRPLTTLRLSEDAIDSLAAGRLEREFLPGLRRLYDGFDGLPAPAQSALTDIAYNVGVAGLGKFTHLRAAVNARDWLRASEECAVSSSREERNVWRARLLEEAAG